MRYVTAAVLLSAFAVNPLVAGMRAQASPAPPPVTPVTLMSHPADPADVASIDAIIAALYDVVSGPPGQARNWERMRSLFIPGARMMPSGLRDSDGAIEIHIFAVNDYIAMSGPNLERIGFRQREIARRTEQFRHIANVFSTYEIRAGANATATGAYDRIRGINSIQLLNDGKRWWIVSTFWNIERSDSPLPQKYLNTTP